MAPQREPHGYRERQAAVSTCVSAPCPIDLRITSGPQSHPAALLFGLMGVAVRRRRGGDSQGETALVG